MSSSCRGKLPSCLAFNSRSGMFGSKPHQTKLEFYPKVSQLHRSNNDSAVDTVRLLTLKNVGLIFVNVTLADRIAFSMKLDTLYIRSSEIHVRHTILHIEKKKFCARMISFIIIERAHTLAVATFSRCCFHVQYGRFASPRRRVRARKNCKENR